MEELAHSEAPYRKLLRVSANLLWTTANNDGQKTTDQIEWQAFTGQTDAQSRGFNWLDAVHPDDREATLTAWGQAVAAGTTYQVQHRLRRHDGVYRTMQARAVPSRDAEGNIIEWVGMHTDITDRLAAEADVGAAHEKLESMLIGMTDGLAIRDNEGHYTYMSERAAQILGVDRKEVIGKHYLEVFPTARNSEIEVQTRRALETRQPAHFERYLAGAVNKWLEYHYYPTDEGLSVYVRDITGRKQSEEALARSEAAARHTQETLEGVLAEMTDGLSIVDKDWCYTYFNEQGGRLLGVRAQDMIGRCIWDVFPPAEQSSFGQACHQAVDTGKPVHTLDHYPELINKWIESHCYPSADGLSIYFRDVTEAKLAEQAIARSEADARRVTRSLEGVLAGMTDGMNILDKDWRYTYFNEQGARLLGMRVEDIIGRTLWDVFPLAETNEFGRVYRESVATGKPGHILDYYPEPLNKWIEAHCYPSADGLSVYFRDVTEAKLAEQAIARSESAALLANVRLEGVVNSMTDGLTVLDKDWRFTYFSENGARMLGVQAKDQVGRLMGDLYPEIETKQFARMYRQATDTGKPVHFEEYYPEPLNKWLDMHVYPIDEGLAVYFSDITPRKLAEQATLKANKKLEAVLDSMTDGLSMLDKDWRFTYFSERGARMLGLTVEERVGLCVWDIFPQGKETAWGKMYLQAVATGRPVHFEEYFPEPRNKWLECRAYPSEDGLSVYFTDITARKQAEEALVRSEAATRKVNETLQGVLASMTDGLNIVDTNWRYTYVNEQSGVLLNVSPAAMLGNILWDMFPGAAEASFGVKMREAVASGKTTRTLDYYPEPVNKWLECHFFPSSEGLSIYFHDVTAKLEAEEALQRSEKLVLAGKLANSIATEIKAPLESAANLLILSLQMTLPDPVRANLVRVEQQIAQVARATTQTLRFHRHSTTIATRVDVSVLLDSALEIFAPRFTAADINVERDYISHPRLFCYGDEVRQVFANLLSNALEATPHGGNVCLRVRPSPFFDGIRITIADTGHGVPAALRSRIFDLFVSTKEDSGAGLGLWVSEGIMRKHKGRISMRSRTASSSSDGPSGTVFAIELPYIGIEPDLAAKAASRRLPHPTPAVA